MNVRCMILLAALPLAAMAEDGATETTRGDVLVIEEVPAAETARAPVATRKVPTRGMDMANVRNAFGAPREEHAAVGDPPITRWDYDGYSVFFEHDKVLHSVIVE